MDPLEQIPELKIVEIEDENFYEFCKAVVLSGEYQHEKMDGQSPMAKIISKLLAEVPYIGHQLASLTQIVDNTNNENDRLALHHAISVSSLSEQNQEKFKQNFRRVLIISAIEIWYAYEQQMKWAYRKVKKSNKSRLQGLQKLGQFAGIRCFKHLVENARGQDAYLAVIVDVGIDDVIAAKYKQWTVDALRMRWPGQDKIKMSAAEFFKYPTPALAPSLTGLIKKNDGDILDDGEKTVVLLEKFVQKFQEEEQHIKPQCLRRPFHAEQSQHLTHNLVPLAVEGLENDEYFKWNDHSDLVDVTYNKITADFENKNYSEPKPRKSGARPWVTRRSYYRRLSQLALAPETDLESLNNPTIFCPDAPTFNWSEYPERPDRPSTKIKEELENSGKVANKVGFGGICIVTGPPQNGKSTYVKHCFNSYSTEDYDYKIWINAATDETLLSNFKKLAEKMEIENAEDLDNLLDKIYEIIESRDKKTFLVFDNAQSPEALSVDKKLGILEFIRSSNKIHLVVTTRHRDFGCEFGWDTFLTFID